MTKIQHGQRVIDTSTGEHGVTGVRDRVHGCELQFLPDGAPNDTGWRWAVEAYLVPEAADEKQAA